MELKADYFDHPSVIHGIGHTSRVWAWTEIIGYALMGDKNTREWYCTTSLHERSTALKLAMSAALIHDMARKHDGVCLEHGPRASATKISLLEELGCRHTEHELEIIAYAVSKHCAKDYPLQGTIEDLTLAILKDADGLDRVRLGELPDIRYFRFRFTPYYVPAASKLLEYCISYSIHPGAESVRRKARELAATVRF